MTPGEWGLGGREGGWRWGVPRSGVAALQGERCVGSSWRLGDPLPPGLLRTVGKWCPVWGGLGDRVHPSGGRGIGDPLPLPTLGNLSIGAGGEGGARGERMDRAPVLMPRAEEVTVSSCAMVLGSSFGGREKLGAFSEAMSFQTDILRAKGKSQMALPRTPRLCSSSLFFCYSFFSVLAHS